MAISIIKDLICLEENSSKVLMENDMLDFNVIKFFGINTRSGKILRPPVRWEFPSLRYPDFATCGCFFRGSMGEFIGVFSMFP